MSIDTEISQLGGWIISSLWVGCAAHCTQRTAASTRVVVGAHSRTTGGISHPANLIINHPEYNRFTLEFDISLVRVAEAIVFTSTVQPIANGRTHVATHPRAQVSGWGQVKKKKL